MNVVTVKFQENVLQNIDESIKKNNFNSRTEFIREAVRDKIDELEKKNALLKLTSLKGKFKSKKTDNEVREIIEKRLN